MAFALAESIDDLSGGFLTISSVKHLDETFITDANVKVFQVRPRQSVQRVEAKRFIVNENSRVCEL